MGTGAKSGMSDWPLSPQLPSTPQHEAPRNACLTRVESGRESTCSTAHVSCDYYSVSCLPSPGQYSYTASPSAARTPHECDATLFVCAVEFT
eukprot:6179876-Pleurochrysis_carterae.AAC.13